MDEDGFTLVTRGGAYGQAVGGGVGVASKKFMDNTGKKKDESGGTRKRKKGKKEKEAFYAFQVHEKKRKGTPSASVLCGTCVNMLTDCSHYRDI